MSTVIIEKTKADDYLQELAVQSEGWLRILIERILLSRVTPSNEFMDHVYIQFLVEHGLRSGVSQSAPSPEPVLDQTTSPNNGFILKSLQHKSGVNALERGATIPFHPKLTVVYGKNGSGKSGFVRMLKRIAGSRTHEPVWQDIHGSKSQNRCKAEVVYLNADTDETLHWNGEYRVMPFDKISVFDGKCIPIYLNKSLEFSYQPFGFELFQTLSSAIQELQERLTIDIQKLENRKPVIHDIFNDGTTIGKFIGKIGPATTLEELKRLPQWDREKLTTLNLKIREQRGLQNLDQQSELLQSRHQKISALLEALLEVQTNLSAQNIRAYFGLAKKFYQLKKKQAQKKGKTLEDYDIAEKESDEWEKFIDASEDYIRIAEHDDYPSNGDVCVYCQQKLSKSAQKLIQLYRELFQEEETSDIEDLEEKLDDALRDLENTSFSDNLSYEKSDYKNILQKRTIDAAFAALNEADDLSQSLASALKSSNPRKLQPVKTTGIIARVRKMQKKLETEITTLEENKRNIFKKSQELNKAINELIDIKKFSNHLPQVIQYIKYERFVTKASLLQGSKLKTKPITDLGIKAWRELISDSFKNRFQSEVSNLNAPSINLEFHGEYGTQVRAKSMEGLEGIDQFLSEGEQKAVALADFFAELSMQNISAPVIFDDPATSFDHERKEKIAKRIVKESETRQIVVFTHDLMFASYLHQEVENPNNREIDASKASFHHLQTQASKIGVVTVNYYPGSTKFDAVIRRVESNVEHVKTLSGEQQIEAIKNMYDLLRGAIEKAVEERIFGGVIKRWSEQIQMFNVERASLNSDKLVRARELHDEFSRYINAHNQSDEMIQHSMPSIETLEADIIQVKGIAERGS